MNTMPTGMGPETQPDTTVDARKVFGVDVSLQMGGGSFGGSSMASYVLSRSQPPGQRHGATFVNQAPSELIAQIRKNPGKDIWLMGGGELAREFLKEDLVDELYLGVVPVLLGEGLPAFPRGFPQRDFALTEKNRVVAGV